MLIYKVLRAEEWAALQAAGHTQGAAVDVADGFIHFSTADQLATTRAKHFAGEDDLILLGCESDAFASDLRWEPSRGGAMFPHLYRELRISDLLWHRPIPLGPQGHVPGDLA